MANRRMFSSDVVETDNFYDLPAMAQAVFFHLSMNADDDGIVSSPKMIIRYLGATEDDVKLLVDGMYIHVCQNGMVGILPWAKMNLIRSDRVKPTSHIEAKKELQKAAKMEFRSHNVLKDVPE